LTLNYQDKVLSHLARQGPALKVLLSILDSLPELALVLTEDGEYLSVFGSQEELLISQPETLIGRKVQDVLPDSLYPKVLSQIKETIETRSNSTLEYQLEVLSGLKNFEAVVIPVPEKFQGSNIVIWFAKDVTAQKINEQYLKTLAFEDPLTGMPNRRLLASRIEEENARCVRHKKHSAILLCDLDNFKTINDRFGHIEGDRILKLISNLIKRSVRKDDFVCRFGGDEFVVILSLVGNSKEEAYQHATSWCLSTKEKLEIMNTKSIISVSSGIEILPCDFEDTTSLLNCIDKKMYKNKASKR